MSYFPAFGIAVFFLLSRVVFGGGVPYDYGFEVEKVVKREEPTVLVQRAMASATPISLRQDVRQLEQDPYAWNIYLLALSMMQFTPQSSLLSWYSVCGIHGVPFVTWDGVNPTPGNEHTGYCQHSSILFPTWHRAYLALLEQVLGNYAQTIASWYPNDADKAGYVNAAANLRLPYWDWAAVPPAGESILPASVQTPTVNVSGPNGVQEISHPLYSYTFRPLNGSVFIEPPWSLYPETVRAPTPENAQAQSNNTLVAITLDASAQSFRSRLYNLFTNTPGYGQFADQAWTNSSGSYDSIEALHDTIHTLTGLQGHMAYIPFSAFDPIFFLHHAMVDRAFAMWQMINPGSWIPPTPAAMNSYTTSMGQIQDSQSSLTPFYSGSNGSFWNSDGLRDTSVFAYTYPEFTGVGGSNGRAQVVRAINRLYGASSPANLARKHGASKSRTGRELSDSDTAQTSGRPRRQEGGGDSSISDAAINRIVTNNQYREWVANIRVDKQALNQSYIIQLRLDESPQDSGSFAQEAQLIGAMGVFAAPPSLRSGKPMHLTSGTIPLTSVLVDNVERGNLQDLEVPSAKPFLVDRLQIRVRLVDGSNIEPTSVHGLSVSIVSARVKVPNSDDSLPIWGRTVHHFDLV